MNIIDLIKSRRSVRKYKQEDLKKGDVHRIVEAGIWAPSGLNNQPWKFKILKAEEKDGLCKFTKYAQIIKDASVAVCVFLDEKAAYNRDKDIMAIGACIQNMLLRAYELGIGTCWLGEILNRKKEVVDYLKVCSDNELMAVVALGYPLGKQGKGSRRKLASFILSS